MTSWLKKQGRWKPLFEDALRRARLPLGAPLRLDDRERLRSARSLARRRRRPVAVHARRRPHLRPAHRLLGRRAAQSGEGDRRVHALHRRSEGALRRLAADAGRLQRRLRRGPARHAEVQHQRLLGAVPPRGRPAVGDDALRARRRWRSAIVGENRKLFGYDDVADRAALRLRSRDGAVVDELRRDGQGGRRLRRRDGRAQSRAAAQSHAARAVAGARAARRRRALRRRVTSSTANWSNHSSCASASGSTTSPPRTAPRPTSCARSTASTTAPRCAPA